MHPRLFQVGHVVVPTFGVVAALGLVCAILLAEWCAGRVSLPGARMADVCLWTLLGTVALSRVLLVVQSPAAFRRYPILVLTSPTLTRYGLVLALVVAGIAVWLAQLPLLRGGDALAPAFLLLGVFLHVGEFCAGTDLGSGTSLAIGNLVRGDEGHHPVALYAAGLSIAALLIVLAVLNSKHAVGQVLAIAVSGWAAGRFLADLFRPSYLLPDYRLPGFLRWDQIGLLVLAVAGLLVLLREPAVSGQTESAHA